MGQKRHIPSVAIGLSLILLAPLAFAQHKGAVKPSGWIADFSKYDEAYYLSLAQIRIGWSQAQVVEEFGKKYKVVESSVVDGKPHETWLFQSYRARQFSDPVDSLVTVDFVDGLVVHAKQVPAPNSDVVAAEIPESQATVAAPIATESPAERLKQLQQLRDDTLITPDEFEAKRQEIIEGL